jgi:hypothetical protein
MRSTLLPRVGYREGLTHLQLWLLHHLISQTIFDNWDVMLSEMEDSLAKGFKGHRLLPYAHWITFLIWKVVTHMSLETMAEWSGATTEFLKYGMTPSQPSRRPEVPESAAEQDVAIRAIVETELEQLEAQQEDVLESDLTDSSNEGCPFAEIWLMLIFCERKTLSVC